MSCSDDTPDEEEAIAAMRALSASLRAQADKVDAAIALLQGAKAGSAPVLTPAQGITSDTVRMMAYIMGRGEAPLADIQAYLKSLGKDRYDLLRPQLTSFAAKGWLVRVRRGIYRITRLGAAKCGLRYELSSVPGGQPK